LADCLDALARRDEGLAANAEAIEALTEPFLGLPIAFAGRMRGMVREYLERCKKLDQEPNLTFLSQIVTVFNRLQSSQENPP
jgi:hypothetical protein